MSTERDVTRVVRSWLDDGATGLPDHVLDRVLADVPATPQRRRWAVRRNRSMSGLFRFAVGAAAVAVVLAVVGISLLPRTGPGISTARRPHRHIHRRRRRRRSRSDRHDCPRKRCAAQRARPRRVAVVRRHIASVHGDSSRDDGTARRHVGLLLRAADDIPGSVPRWTRRSRLARPSRTSSRRFERSRTPPRPSLERVTFGGLQATIS